MQRRQFLQALNAMGANSVLFVPGGYAANATMPPPTAEAALLTSAPMQPAPALDQLWRGLLNPVCRADWPNIDVEDLRTVLSHKGDCAFGFGAAPSAEAAALTSISHPSLGQHRLRQASALMVVVRAPPGVLMLRDSVAAMRSLRQHLALDPWIIYGTYFEDMPDKKITVAVLASGIHGSRGA